MQKRKKGTKNVTKPLDTFSGKRGRGRPGVRASEIQGRAGNYQYIFNEVWDRLWPLLSGAMNEEAVAKAFQEGASPYTQNFMTGLYPVILEILRDPQFPKRRKAQVKFMAESLAGLGSISPRRSRDICAEGRPEQKKAHHIIRYEFHIECSCGYKGRSRDHACPRCGAQIQFPAAATSMFP
jgi:hypothetical protein